MYAGEAAINFLADDVKLNNVDLAASSHWRHYHSAFNFTDDTFHGLQGFGDSRNFKLGLRLGVERLLQSKFRSMGKIYPEFHCINKLANQITSTQRRVHNLDVLRQSITLAFLKTHVFSLMSQDVQSFPTVCIIGDGFGTMTALLQSNLSASCVILINLTKTLMVDLWYLKKYMGNSFSTSVDLVINQEGLTSALAKCSPTSRRIIAIRAIDHELLQHCPIDLAINIASMQEMDLSIIDNYFYDLRKVASKRELYFYCCNREEKKLPDGSITRFSQYPWDTKDHILVDELCPWHQQYYSLKPPLYRKYDGVHRHRLLKFYS